MRTWQQPADRERQIFVYPLRCLHNFVSDFIYRFVVRDFFFGFRFYLCRIFQYCWQVRISYNFFRFSCAKPASLPNSCKKRFRNRRTLFSIPTKNVHPCRVRQDAGKRFCSAKKTQAHTKNSIKPTDPYIIAVISNFSPPHIFKKYPYAILAGAPTAPSSSNYVKHFCGGAFLKIPSIFSSFLFSVLETIISYRRRGVNSHLKKLPRHLPRTVLFFIRYYQIFIMFAISYFLKSNGFPF